MSILRTIERDMIKNVYWFQLEYVTLFNV